MSDTEYWFFLPDVLPVAVHTRCRRLRSTAQNRHCGLSPTASCAGWTPTPPHRRWSTRWTRATSPGCTPRGHHPPADCRVHNLAGEPRTLAVTAR